MMCPVLSQTAAQLPVQRLCVLANMARSTYYRLRTPESREKNPQNEQLRHELHKVCTEFSSYGYRRATKELRRRGLSVGFKRIRSLMNKEHLSCRRKKRWIGTTNSQHGYRIYPNLAAQMVVDRPNQLWVADITYVRLRYAFVYLAVILDAFSRRAVGWALSHHIDTQLALAALQQALQTRVVSPGLVHHSDRGVQYASGEYVSLLLSKNIAISMSRKGYPYDNAKAESFMKTLKTEEVSITEYESFSEAQQNIGHFIEVVYNHKRLHSALGYLPPAEFEADYFNNPSTLTRHITVPM